MGGAAYFYGGSLTIRKCRFDGNWTKNLGGAVFISSSPSSAHILDSLFAGNRAEIYGGGIYGSGSKILVANCTVVKNFATYGGAGIKMQSAVASEIVNTIIGWNRYGYNQYGGAWPPMGQGQLMGSDSISATYNIIEEGGGVWTGTGNRYYVPALTLGPEYRPVVGEFNTSECIDKGIPVTWGDREDADGETRGWDHPDIVNGDFTWDIGAYEFTDIDGDGLSDGWEKKYFGNLGKKGSDDTDLDGLLNEMEYMESMDPSLRFDADGDGLSDDLEKYMWRNPNNWDENGDGMPDGVDYDTDGDGLNDFDESRYGASPALGDTDEDGVSDYDEVANNSSPADGSDNGQAANCILLELRVGDHSRSASERYELNIGPVHHMATDFGKVATATYAFVRGKEYSFHVRWVATKDPSPDYDYTATIGGLPPDLPQPGWLAGQCFLINDPDGILGRHEESSYDYAKGKSGMLHVLNVDINQVISDQLPGIEVNKLPVGDGSAGSTDPNNPMIMGNRSDNKAYLQIKASVAPLVSASVAFIGVRREGTTAILDSHAVVPSGKTPLSFSPASRGLYEAVAGIDADGSGTLTDTEVCSVFPQKVLTITQGDYNSDMANIDSPVGYVYLLLASGIAVNYLSEFHSAGLAGAQLPGATRTFYWQSPTEPTHPLGQDWNAAHNSQGICPLNTFAPSSAFSKSIGSTHQVAGLIKTALGNRKTEVQTFFADPLSPDTYTFPVWSWSASVGTSDWMLTIEPHPDIWGSIGGVSISGNITATVRKSDLHLISIHYTGSLDDLYDGNYKRDFVNQVIATVQTGYPTLGQGGRTFKTHVDFDVTSTSVSFDFSP